MEFEPATPVHLIPVLEQLQAHEPVFVRPEHGATRADLERMTDDGFWETGASGRRYSRAFVIETLLARYARPHEDVWRTHGFHCAQLGPGTFMVTCTLVQDEARVTRRMSVWRRTDDGWKILYHQGTVVE